MTPKNVKLAPVSPHLVKIMLIQHSGVIGPVISSVKQIFHQYQSLPEAKSRPASQEIPFLTVRSIFSPGKDYLFAPTCFVDNWD